MLDATFVEGATWLHRFASGATSRELFWAHYQTAVVVVDFFIGDDSSRLKWGP